jgi:Tfp pilus assembly protein PilO
MAIVSNLWILIILYTGYNVFEKMQLHDAEMVALNDQIPVVQTQIQKGKKERKQLESYFADIEEAKQKITKVAEEVERLQKQFPVEISDTDNLAMISAIADSLNIKNISLAPGTEENKGFYITKSYQVKVQATYLQILIFLEKVAEAQRLLNVSEIKMALTDQKQKGRFQVIGSELTLEVYKYNPSHKENSGIDELEKQFKEQKAEGGGRKRKRKSKDAEE